MQTINILSFEPALDYFLQLFNRLANNQVELQWSYQRDCPDGVSSGDMCRLLVQDADALLMRRSRLEYPFHETVEVLSVLQNPNDLNDPLVFVTLKNTSRDLALLNLPDLRKRYGKVSIAGFGPGNPELLTLKTEKLLQKAHVIFYDDLLEASFLDQYLAEKVYVGKRKGRHSYRQEDINELLFQAGAKGKNVVRLKGGDPLVFGRGGEEYHYLKRRFVEAEIIPGITAASAAAASGIIPLTSRGISTSVAFALGHNAVINKLPKADTLVFYMGASQQKDWACRLLNEGWAPQTPVAVVRNASLPDEEIRRYTLSELADSQTVLPAPSLVMVGYTASHDVRAQGRKWLYTGTDADDFTENGVLIHTPLIKISPIGLDEELFTILSDLQRYDRIVFSTPFAVKEFFRLLFEAGHDVRVLGSVTLSSLGGATSKALLDFGLRVDPETEDNSSASLLKSFKTKGVISENILLPCSTGGLSVLPAGLSQLGNRIDTIAIYHNELPDNVARHNLEEFYGVEFTSPTTVKNFFRVYDHLPSHLKVKTRGRFTRELLESYLAGEGQRAVDEKMVYSEVEE